MRDAGTGGLMVWLVVLVLAGVLGALAWAGIARLGLRRLAEARAAAAVELQVLAASFLALDSIRQDTQARLDALPEVDDVKVGAVRAMCAATREPVASATATYQELSREYDARRVGRLRTEEATTAADVLSAATATVRRCTLALRDVEAELDALDDLRAGLPERVAEIRAALAEVRRLLPERSGQGFLVGAYEAVLPRIEGGCTETEQLLRQVRVGEADSTAGTTWAIASELLATVSGLPEQQQRLCDELGSLRGRHKHCRLLLLGAQALTARLEAARHPSCTEDLAALLARTADKLAEMRSLLDRLADASSMRVQAFDEAEELVEHAEALRVEIEADCPAPVLRREQLQTLDSSLPATRDGIAAALEDLRRRSSHHEKTGVPPRRLDELTRELADLTAELEQDRPRTLLLADRLADLARRVAEQQAPAERARRRHAGARPADTAART